MQEQVSESHKHEKLTRNMQTLDRDDKRKETHIFFEVHFETGIFLKHQRVNRRDIGVSHMGFDRTSPKHPADP